MLVKRSGEFYSLEKIMSDRMVKWLIGLGIAVVSLLVLWGLFRGIFMDFVDNYELGYKYDKRTGKTEILKDSGYYVNWPIMVQIHTIDLRPGQVCMNANSRVLNCKLVKFNPEGFEDFLAMHGRGAGEGSSSQQGSSGAIYEILKSYAFDVSGGADCPFLIVVDDMRRKDSGSTTRTEIPSTPVTPSMAPSAPVPTSDMPTSAPAPASLK